MPLVSVIVPVYNVEPYIERAVGSIINQVYNNIEIILINDGSTDKSGLLCERLKKKDKRVLIKHQVNKGVSATRNKGICISRGEYILFVDADDEINPMMIKEMVDCIIKYNVDVVVCGINQVYVNASGDKCNEIQYLLKSDGFYDGIFFIKNMRSDDNAISNNCESLCNKLFSRELFNANLSLFDININYVEDGNFLLDMFSQDLKIYYIREPYYSYYSYDKNIRKSSMHYFLKERFYIYKKLYLKQLKYILGKLDTEEISKCKHDYINKVILAIILLCRSDVNHTCSNLKNVITNIVNDETVVDALPYYRRKKDNSWTIPLLIKIKNIDYLIYFARKIAKRRYGV